MGQEWKHNNKENKSKIYQHTRSSRNSDFKYHHPDSSISRIIPEGKGGRTANAAVECYLFAPFNKLYRSPIVQIKSSTALNLARKSKTAALVDNQKIVDGIKYKFRHIFTD